jgi:OOP family OmpA-OmpF porin
MGEKGLVQRNLGRAAAGALIASISLGSAAAVAYEPGWYFGAGGAYSKLEDSDGTLTGTTTQVNGTPTPPDSTACALGDPLAPITTGILGIEQGCLLGLLGPGTSGDPGTDPNASTQSIGPNKTSYTFKGGFGVTGAIGYLFDGGFRPEVAFSLAENDIDKARVATTTGTAPLFANSGKLTATRVMGNLWYDLDFGSDFAPYLGIGAGMQQTKMDLDGNSAKSSGSVYQAGAGIGYWINDKTVISLDYRYIVADDPEIETSSIVTTSTGTTRNDLKQTFEYRAQNLGVSMRYSFGGAGDVDSDGDGVPDRKDKCPNTPKGVQVYSDGCPLDLDGDGVPDYLDKCPGTPPGVKVNAQGCEIDSDGDGVPDSRDQCPGTPRGVRVDPNGCPLDADGDGIPDYLDKCPKTAPGTKVDEKGCPLTDTDGDGVPDQFDKCPGSPPGIPVGPDGCPLDSDGDGIPDYLDECPHSPPGAKVLPNGCALKGDCRKPRPGEQVDAHGCALEQRFILRGVKFEFDSDRLLPESKVILNDVALTLASYPDVKVEVEGHTDNIGTDAYNLGLSERRAIAVKTYLGGRNVKGDRLVPVGYGESRPIASNDAEAGREENRRVEFKVIE